MKKRFIFSTLLLFIAVGYLRAQTTSVTLQATDADGQTWNNGTWSASLYSPPGVPSTNYIITGGSTLVPNQQQTGSLNSTGGASLTVTPNTSISPSGTQWQFNICPQATPTPCSQYSVSITGVSQTVSPALPAIRLSLVNPLTRVTAYTNAEVTGANVGSSYFNLISLSVIVCQTSTLSNCILWGAASAGLPAGVAAGSVLASNGISQPGVYQSKPVIDARDSGVDITGATDTTTTMQTAINAACAAHGALVFPNGSLFKISSTLVISKCNGITIDSSSSQGQTTEGGGGSPNALFMWYGAAGGTVLEINQTRDSYFGHFSIDVDASNHSAVGANVGLVIDEIGSVTNITTNNHFDNVQVTNFAANPNFIGINICPTAPGNCEQQNFDRLLLLCASPVPTSASSNGVGIQYSGGEPFFDYIHGINANYCSQGISVSSVDNLDIDGGLMATNWNDILILSGTAVRYANIRSESAQAQIVLGSSSLGGPNDVVIENNTFSGLTNSTTTINYAKNTTGSIVRLIKNNWDLNATVIPFGLMGSGVFSGLLDSQDNRYPSGTVNCISGAFSPTNGQGYSSLNDSPAGYACNYGSLHLGGARQYLLLDPAIFSEAPACAAGTEGATKPFNDSTTATPGATITGGGTNHVEGYCNGTNWVVESTNAPIVTPSTGTFNNVFAGYGGSAPTFSYGFTIVENPLSDGGNFTAWNSYVLPKVPSSGLVEPATTAADNAAIYTGATWSTDQASQVTLATGWGTTGANYLILLVRASGSTAYYFSVLQNGSGASFQKYISGTPTPLATVGSLPALAAADVWVLSAIGTTITVTQNGVVRATATDSSITSGSPGFGFYASSTITSDQYSQWNGVNDGSVVANGQVVATLGVTGATYSTATNCAVNSVSPAACGSAASGAVVIPTTTATYTINTSAVTAHSRIQLTWLTFASDLPGTPTCVAPSATSHPTISAVSAGVSFTIALTSTTGQTCPMYEIKN